MKHNPDNRADNVAHIQKSIDDTVRNIRETDKTLRATSNDKTREELSDKNERRKEALESFRREIKDEAAHLKGKKNF
ncbi:small acid-soluble spore protein Tlp [Oscillospiraceae bacterium CM]|nr:small acid-soluble spore protein Tlp [Oscillospiraceae bacterium CM]